MISFGKCDLQSSEQNTHFWAFLREKNIDWTSIYIIIIF